MPSNGVIVADDAIGREIRQLRADLKEDLGEIKSSLGALLPREVYIAEHNALVRRVETVERDLERAEAERKRSEERSEAERINHRRWLITAIVVPLGSAAVTIILAVT
jgi:hypothetical protein